MKQIAERAVFVSLVPLALALGAFVVRETTRISVPSAAPVAHAKELVPPAMLMLAAAAKSPDRTLRVDSIASQVRIVSSDDDDGRESKARVAGTMRLLADGTIESLHLSSEPEDAVSNSSGLLLHAGASVSRATPVPGVRASDLSCTLDRGQHRVTEAVLHVEWMRTLGGAVHMHAVGTLVDPASAPRWTDLVRFRTANRVVAFDLRFLPAE